LSVWTRRCSSSSAGWGPVILGVVNSNRLSRRSTEVPSGVAVPPSCRILRHTNKTHMLSSSSAVDPDPMGSLDPYPDQGGKKLSKNIRKKLINLFLKCWMFSLRTEGFSCSLDKSQLQILIKKRFLKISAVFFYSVFGHQNPGSGLNQD
jgi:hypothetical protein